uniref:Uncharacterized protein n=1 Tax=Sphaerodactylus townsendi TaxID=933632 RepID=A0ACB8ET40_9SAUR
MHPFPSNGFPQSENIHKLFSSSEAKAPIRSRWHLACLFGASVFPGLAWLDPRGLGFDTVVLPESQAIQGLPWTLLYVAKGHYDIGSHQSKCTKMVPSAAYKMNKYKTISSNKIYKTENSYKTVLSCINWMPSY